MKKFLVPCLVLFVVFLLCFGSIFILFRKEATELFQKITSSVKGESSAILLIDSGEVEFKNSENETYEAGYDEQELYKGAYIKTGANSQSHLILSNNSIISLDQNTEIKLTDIPTEKNNYTFIEQFAGNAWHRVGELTGGNYQVETPNAIAAVRGTIFGTGIGENGEDEIFSIENEVSVGQKETVEGVDQVLNEKTIAPDKYTKIQGLSEVDGFEVVNIPSTISNSSWFSQNKELDELFKNFDYKNFGDRKELINKYRQETDGGLLDGLLPDVSDLGPIDSVEAESGDSCREVEGMDIDETLAIFDQIEGLFDFGFSADELKSFYIDLQDVCSDGYITNDEAQYLSSRHAFLNGN